MKVNVEKAENELLGRELMSLSAKKKQQSTDDEIGHNEAIIMEHRALIEENRHQKNQLQVAKYEESYTVFFKHLIRTNGLEVKTGCREQGEMSLIPDEC